MRLCRAGAIPARDRIRLTSRGFSARVPREIRHFFIAHVSHVDPRRFVALVERLAIIAAQTFAVAAVIANENIGLKVRAKHVDLALG